MFGLRAVAPVLGLLVALSLVGAADAAKGEDGASPKGSGYVWVDAVAGSGFYKWENSGTDYPYGTTIFDRYSTDNLPTGFSHTYYGTTYNGGDKFYVAEDGFISYVQPAGSLWDPQDIPVSTAPNGVIAPFWIDLDTACSPTVAGATGPAAVGRIRSDYLTTGHPRVTVTWDTVDSFDNYSCNKDDWLSFQVKLFDDSDVIEFHAEHALSTVALDSFCKEFRIGIENQAGSDALDRMGYVSGNGCSPILIWGAWDKEEMRIWDNELDDVDNQVEVVDMNTGPLTIDLETSDDPLWHSGFSPPSQGNIPNFPTGQTYVPQTALYTPNIGYYGIDSFDYDVEDGYDAKQSGTVTIHVNHPPEPVDDTFVVAADSVDNALDVIKNDNDPYWIDTSATANVKPRVNAVLYSPAKGQPSIVPGGSGITYTPVPGFCGTDTFSYEVTDSRLLASAEVTVEVNCPPEPVDDVFMVAQNSPTNQFDVMDNDGDQWWGGPDSGNTVAMVDPDNRISAASASNGDISHDGILVYYTPDTGFYGMESILYTVSDTLLTGDATATVTVNAIPVANADEFVVNEGTGPTSLAVLENDDDPFFNDVDGAAGLAPTGLIVNPSAADATANGLEVEYQPAAGFYGTETFTYQATDGYLESTPATVTVNVNAMPIANDDTVTMSGGELAELDPMANDEDPFFGDSLKIIAVSGSAGLVIISADGTKLEYTAPSTSSDTITYTISDGYATSEAVVFVSLGEATVNVAPKMSPGQILAGQGEVSVVLLDYLNVYDPDTPAAQVNVRIVEGTPLGQLSRISTILASGDVFTLKDLQGGLITFLGPETGTGQMTFEVGDGDGWADEYEVPVVVIAPNVLPKFERQAKTLEVNQASSSVVRLAHLPVHDPDGSDNKMRYTLILPPTFGDLTLDGSPLGIGATFLHAKLAGGKLSYDQNGEYQISDGAGFLVTDERGGEWSPVLLDIEILTSLEANPEADADGDGQDDSVDLCEGYSENTGDFDADGLGDECDPDRDGDGVLDDHEGVKDNCLYAHNPEQTDSDGDGIGDACEEGAPQAREAGTVKVTKTTDTDGDLLPDIRDNCPSLPNPDQRDTDGDGRGDLCDADADGDGIAVGDNCPARYNPGQEDSDRDGTGDLCDTFVNRQEVRLRMEEADAQDFAVNDPASAGRSVSEIPIVPVILGILIMMALVGVLTAWGVSKDK